MRRIRFNTCFSYILLLLFVVIAALLVQLFSWIAISLSSSSSLDAIVKHPRLDYNSFLTVTIGQTSASAKTSQQNCTYHTCFDVYRCGFKTGEGLPQISVYIYPPSRYVDEEGVPLTLPMSAEFAELIQSIANSAYYTDDPSSACLLVPAIDLLNQNGVRLASMSKILESLPNWNGGVNHILFNMLPGSPPDYNATLDVERDKAIVAGGGFSTWTYRPTYDVSIPVFNPLNTHHDFRSDGRERYWLAVSAQTGLHHEYISDLELLEEKYSNFLLLHQCPGGHQLDLTERCNRLSQNFTYPHILQEATFCLVIRGNRLGQLALSDCMMASSIPVIIADSYVLPFSEVLDWNRAAIKVDEDDLPRVFDILSQVTPARIAMMRRQVEFYWQTYFSSMRAITLTTLQIINDRVYPYASMKYEDWNEPPSTRSIANPPLMPLIPSKAAGFTAVILTFDRLESLYKIIQKVSLAPSLAKVLVVWNNQIRTPPPAPSWPKINKPLKVVQTRHNKLSNRFYPYDEIETEAILALDDDILMLTIDELEFGYEVWREFSDQLVGFPSRLHLWDNITNSWRYESEWTSEISMVLTGAAFYHKYYNYLYTNAMPGNIKSWVDEHMNCEDIAFNFLVANASGKPPIKVTPRQKFRCPECSNGVVLSADLGGHMVERSECINKFAQIYGMMPLRTVDFRADPVLYREDFPSEKKWFEDIGSL